MVRDPPYDGFEKVHSLPSMAGEETTMRKKKGRSQARKGRRTGQAPSTQAGKFVKEEVRRRERGRRTRSRKQAVAIGLSRARRAGLRIPPKNRGLIPGDRANGADP
jgi:hypothetical protein